MFEKLQRDFKKFNKFLIIQVNIFQKHFFAIKWRCILFVCYDGPYQWHIVSRWRESQYLRDILVFCATSSKMPKRRKVHLYVNYFFSGRIYITNNIVFYITIYVKSDIKDSGLTKVVLRVSLKILKSWGRFCFSSFPSLSALIILTPPTLTFLCSKVFTRNLQTNHTLFLSNNGKQYKTSKDNKIPTTAPPPQPKLPKTRKFQAVPKRNDTRHLCPPSPVKSDIKDSGLTKVVLRVSLKILKSWGRFCFY